MLLCFDREREGDTEVDQIHEILVELKRNQKREYCKSPHDVAHAIKETCIRKLVVILVIVEDSCVNWTVIRHVDDFRLLIDIC